MKKILPLLFLVVFLVPLAVPAAPLYYEKISVTQKDGRVLNLFASGDEFYNWLHDAEGYTIILDKSTGNYVYAVLVNDELVPTKLFPGFSNPSALGIKPWLRMSDEKIRQNKFSEFGNNPPGEGDAPKTGTLNNLVVYIRFADESEFTDQTSVYNTMFNNSTTGANSMYNYFKEVSYNQLSITSTYYPVPSGSLVISYQDSHVRNYYKPYDSISNPVGYMSSERTTREHALLRDAIAYIASQVPVSLNIDGDNDGYVDNVCFIIYGSTTAWSTLLWPHRWALYSYSALINGKRVYDYNFQLQNSLKSSGPGVLCHEMFHSLGAPDLYHYTSNGIAPCYRWDVMDNNANPPEHMGAYMKWKYGNWISSIPVISSGTHSLKPLTSSTNNCYRVNSPYTTTEYFVLEYRKKLTTFENSIPDNGLLVYRINTAYNGNANGPPDEVYIYRPGGTLIANGSPAQANFSSLVGRTVMNASTNPSPFLTDGSQGGLSISGVGSPDTTITFTLSIPPPPPPGTPALLSPSNGATGVSLTPTLDWSDISNTEFYRLQVSDNNLFSDFVIDDSTLTASQYSAPSGKFIDNTQYFWRVYAKNSGGYSPASSVFSFTTLSVPPLVQIGIFNDGACLVFKAKSNVNVTNRTVTKITFSFRYASSLSVSFQNPVSSLGFVLGQTSASQGYNYRSYSTVQSTLINWCGEIEYEIMRVNISGNGTGVFELSNKIKNYNWYIELNGSNHTNTTLPFYVASTESPLPVTLNMLKQEVKNSGVLLTWETSREINNSGFDIERKFSADTVWNKIGFAEGKGNSNNIEKYTFEDRNLMNGKYNYRLKQIDYNGNYGYHIFSGEAVVNAPAKYSLSQNYPNPFNPVTKISFELPEKSFVTMKIYDITGKEISVLVNDYKVAGRYEVQWDGSRLASGVYFYRITAQNYSAIKRMILLK